MPAHFLYRSHVSSGGKITTPDIRVERCYLAVRSGDDLTLDPQPVDRLIDDGIAQVSGDNASIRPAVFLCGGTYGTLIAPAGDIVGGCKLVARTAWRLPERPAGLSGMSLTLSELDWPVGEIVVLAGIQARLGTDDIPPGTAVLCAGPPVNISNDELRIHVEISDDSECLGFNIDLVKLTAR